MRLAEKLGWKGLNTGKTVIFKPSSNTYSFKAVNQRCLNLCSSQIDFRYWNEISSDDFLVYEYILHWPVEVR
jgi:3-deoxy-D-arabino-heptulosonate 7-phosphate (DAHP) synthase